MLLGKIGIHTIGGGEAVNRIRRMAQQGAPYALVTTVDRPGLAAEIKAISPSTRVITRFYGDEPFGFGARIEQGQDPIRVADDWFNFVMGGKVAEEIWKADYLLLMNEQDPAGALNYERMGRASVRLAQRAFGQFGVRSAHLGLNAGTPEADEVKGLENSGLFDYIARTKDCLAVHEGVIPPHAHTNVMDGYGANVPGFQKLSNAGYLSYRHRFMLAEAKDRFDIAVTEFYSGGGYADAYGTVDRFEAYCDKADYGIIGVCPFTLDPTGGWGNQDYGFAYDELERRMLLQRGGAKLTQPYTFDDWTHEVIAKALNVRADAWLSVVPPNIILQIYSGAKVRIWATKSGWGAINPQKTLWISLNPAYVKPRP